MLPLKQESVNQIKLHEVMETALRQKSGFMVLVHSIVWLISHLTLSMSLHFLYAKLMSKTRWPQHSLQFSSVQFSRSVMSDSLQSHGLQHARPPCPSQTLRACSDSCPLSWWCHPAILSCHPLLLPPSIFSSIRVFSNESILLIRWPKDWSFSFSISPPNEYSGLISFRIDWLDLLTVQGTLKSLLQHHSSKAPILRHSAFFIVQLSHPYMTTGKP